MSRKQYLIWLLPIFWLGVTIFLTFQNGDSSGRFSHILAEKICAIINSPEKAYGCEVAIRDLAHFSIHFILAFLTALAAYYEREDPFRPGIITFAICLLIAVSDEIGQIFVSGRFFEFYDILQNLLGVIYGTMCFIFYKSIEMHLKTVRN